jgi:hypothetical protein
LVNIVQKAVWNDGVNYALNVSGYSMFGGIQMNGQDSNNIYKRVGDLTISSHSLSSITFKTNSGFWKAMRLYTAGTSINTSLNVSGTTIFNNNMGIGTTSKISGVKLDCKGTIYSHSLMIGDINSINANSNNTQVPGNSQLLINPPTATNGAIIQTIQQGTGFKSRLNYTRFWWLCLYWK